MDKRKNQLLTLALSLSAVLCMAQEAAIHNYGGLQLHKKGQIGFHAPFINDHSFDQNKGLVGFYQDEGGLSISGGFSPTFYDFELAVESHLNINLPIIISNSLNFIYGDIKADRNNQNVYVKLMDEAIYDGEMNRTKIDGHVAVEGQKEFRFPVGYDEIIRPLKVRFIDGAFLAKCEFFRENPNAPESFYESFDIRKRDSSLGSIYDEEFWRLNTSGMVQISLTWNAKCNLSSQVKNIEHVTVSGWNKKDKRWVNLGNTSCDGDTAEGLVTSNTFNANDYEIFTLGFLFDLKANLPGNYVLTPNGDGINDFFDLKIIEQSPNNEFRIFNRSGMLVYEKTNYRNEFSGIANRGLGHKNKALPKGVYFYILDVKDLNQQYQGYFYLAL
ncbi:gliding motility-associated C-terminal domain-containing protein [Flavobacteriaceae bacterium TP-CH-4]|uniref:Gliding motility-associated C-terminal domain-containing protein n=1 Tax=Pelagihabitans pacificus TaxID=2696054 RepID=A0A967EC16_9FLAO|nr:gliding motility-associated C-terminal domain-containing protein [Pelagihabitans pacificus]NHF60811.1 gliding motility-associated C-terminal domain-containing protein [Pelagihabitans pacificus]